MAREEKIEFEDYKGYTICQFVSNCLVFWMVSPKKCWRFRNSIRAKIAIDNNYLENENDNATVV